MNNIIKTLILTTPALALLFFYVTVKQSEREAFLERESARFDQEFAVFMNSTLTPQQHKEFWSNVTERAKKEEQEAQKKLEEKRLKAENFEKELEKALNSTNSTQ